MEKLLCKLSRKVLKLLKISLLILTYLKAPLMLNQSLPVRSSVVFYSKIELLFLPAYSPNVNPIERLWKFMHSVVSNNKFYANFKTFTDSIRLFFENILNIYNFFIGK